MPGTAVELSYKARYLSSRKSKNPGGFMPDAAVELLDILEKVTELSGC